MCVERKENIMRSFGFWLIHKQSKQTKTYFLLMLEWPTQTAQYDNIKIQSLECFSFLFEAFEK